VIEIHLDLSEIRQFADDLKVAQREVTWACAKTINDSVFEARQEISDDWPRFVTQRQTNFPRAALHVRKADTHNLTAELVEERSNILGAHDTGATISARSRSLAIPVSSYRASRMTQHGLRADAKLAAVLRRASAKRSVRVVGNKIYVASRGLGLKLAFVLKQSIQQKADFPATQIFNDTVTRVVNNTLVNNLMRALRTSSRFID
jgi:hypothetical protein